MRATTVDTGSRAQYGTRACSRGPVRPTMIYRLVSVDALTETRAAGRRNVHGGTRPKTEPPCTVAATGGRLWNSHAEVYEQVISACAVSSSRQHPI